MRKLWYTIIGGVIGLLAGFVVSLCMSVWAFFTCSSVSGHDEMSIYIVLTAIGLVCGFVAGAFMDKEDKERQAEARRRDEENARIMEERERERQLQEDIRTENEQMEQWKKERLLPALHAFGQITPILEAENGMFRLADPFYDQSYASGCKRKLDDMTAEAFAKDSSVQHVSYQSMTSAEIDAYIRTLHENIRSTSEDFRKFDFRNRTGLASWLVQLCYLTGDNGFMKAAEAAYQFCVRSMNSVTKMAPDDYGNIVTPVNTDEQMNEVAAKTTAIEDQIRNKLSRLTADVGRHYADLADCLYPEMAADAETLMWYYAKKSPFDTNKFEEACERYGSFARKADSGAYDTSEIAARVFSQQAIGGEATVQSDWKTIEQWLLAASAAGEGEKGQALASALAWMELYQLELKVLKMLVQQKVQLHENVQERLRFLSEGGTSNIRVYDTVSPDRFLFDSSSESWNEKDISICFRNLKMKKITPHYSLVISGWKKSLPLSSGQKLSHAQLFSAFEAMVRDFDGEVTCEQQFAKAVDLENLEYPEAVLFRFTSERNRCVSMLFHCDKFGRNLNITILTLFTPEEGMSLERMENYALAIRSNVYVKSFQETILQTVDDTVKEEMSVYGDSSSTSSSTVFE